jgi:hypothetical protein
MNRIKELQIEIARELLKTDCLVNEKIKNAVMEENNAG